MAREGELKIGVSSGTASVLGLRHTQVKDCPTTAYLLIDERCARDCQFCSRARSASGRADALSRVTWPDYDEETTVAAVAQAFERGSIERCCIQVPSYAEALGDVQDVVRSLRESGEVPVCAAFLPRTLAEVGEILAAGAENVGIGLDAACERVYRDVKAADWQRITYLIEAAAHTYPGHINVHLIVGLGESEEEMCQTMQWLADLGVSISLFAFTPLRGTPLAERTQPPLDTYRRMQAALHLLVHCGHRIEQWRFQEGRLVHFGEDGALDQLRDGQAFRTSGCSGCNRPYYNERPGGVMYNYPRPLSAEEAEAAVLEMEHRD